MTPDQLFASVEARQMRESTFWRSHAGMNVRPLDNEEASVALEAEEPDRKKRYEMRRVRLANNRCPVCGTLIRPEAKACAEHCERPKWRKRGPATESEKRWRG